MVDLIISNWVVFLIAFFIGVATAWWIWANRADNIQNNEDITDETGVEYKGDEAGHSHAAHTKHITEEERNFEAKETIAAEEAATPPLPKIAPAQGEPDDLQKIKGVGPKLSHLLESLGIVRFDQIAAWNADDIAEVDNHLGSFKGRIDRDNWVDQAGYLAKDDISNFEEKYGKL